MNASLIEFESWIVFQKISSDCANCLCKSLLFGLCEFIIIQQIPSKSLLLLLFWCYMCLHVWCAKFKLGTCENHSPGALDIYVACFLFSLTLCWREVFSRKSAWLHQRKKTLHTWSGFMNFSRENLGILRRSFLFQENNGNAIPPFFLLERFS